MVIKPKNIQKQNAKTLPNASSFTRIKQLVE